ncbi:hypothetical protein, partial [Brevundimonas bullata]|uniref:hypothetical protein n=1 Tax=Brevundimonas bullata TaxID=13160 RepID=UPI002FD9FE65
MTTVFALLRSILRRVAFDGSIGRACADAVVMRSPFVVSPGSRPFRGEAMRAGRLGISPVKAARLLLLLLALAPATALAQEPAPASPSASLCVQVDVGGDRAGHLDCAAEAL